MLMGGMRLATRATIYAGSTVLVLTAIQIHVLAPHGTGQWAAILAPFFICSLFTYVITHVLVKHRADDLLDIYTRFERGDLDERWPQLSDPEFRSARKLFVRLAKDLHEAKRALEQRDAERRRLFADVVHELGTPVSSLLGLAEALERPQMSDDPTARKRVVDAVAHESDRLALFVEDLRDIAQLDDPAMKLHKEPIDLAELARGVVDRLNAIPDSTSVELEAEPAPIEADPGRIEQIIVNLVKNARRYAGSPARILVKVSANGSRTTLQVEDGGKGVAEEDLAKLGQRMRRLDQSRTRKTGGSGLGLSIVTAIAERHGGSVRYGRSSLGGLSVSVDVPT